jgi:cadmium resistance protein CadD (predicted permease)
MHRVAATAATAATLFVGTNLDDVIVLAVLSLSSRVEGLPKRWHIWAGQYAGVAVLVTISMLAALGLALLPDRHAWLLGFVPLVLGVQKLVGAVRASGAGARPSAAVATGLAGVIGVTIANGGDNIAAYTPVFRTESGSEIAVTLAVFAAGVAIWCAAGSWLVSHAKASRFKWRRVRSSGAPLTSLALSPPTRPPTRGDRNRAARPARGRASGGPDDEIALS